jgi:hypothetical protein
MDSIQDFIASPGGIAVKAALTAAFLDFAFGIFASVRDGTFALDAVAAFVRKHLAGRVLPISLLALAGWYSQDTAMIAAAGAALAAYAAETLGSVYGSIRPPAPSDEKVNTVNPIPVD